MCAKLRTVAASNNRDHARNLSLRTLVVTFNRSHVNISRATPAQSLLLLLARGTHMMVLFFTHIPFTVNHTINATPPERLQQYQQSTVNSQSLQIQKTIWQGNFLTICLKQVLRCGHGRNLVGDVSPPLFQVGIICHVHSTFSLQVLYLERFQK